MARGPDAGLTVGRTSARNAAPTPERVASLAGADEDRLRWMFIGNVLEAVELNRGKLRTKSRWLTTSQFALFATVFQLGAYSVWHEVKG